MAKVVLSLALFSLLASAAGAGDPQDAFPASWAGSWAGPCVVVKDGAATLTFPMELHVAPIEGRDAWTWRIVYGEGARRQVRPYELLPVPGETRRFVIDEKNGIRIDAYLENDRLHCRFGVLDNLIETTYARDGDTLRVTLTTFGAVASTASGGADGVPPVAAYPLLAVQRGTLRRGGSAPARSLGAEGRVRAMLGSSALEEQAWGAYLAGSLRFAAAPSSALVAALLDALESAGRVDEAVAAAALDALIRLDARVEPDRLVGWVETYPAQVILLLGRDPTRARAALLALLERDGLDDATWMAAVGLLVEDRAPGVAEHVLRGLGLRLEVSVLPEKNMAIGIGGGDGERAPKVEAMSRAEPRAGWPPYVTYALTDVPATGDLVASSSPRPIYARRAVFPPGAANRLGFRTELRRNQVRILALAALKGTPARFFRLKELDRLTVYWEGEDDYVDRVQTRWLYIQIQYDGVLDDLVEAGLLSPAVRSELALPLRIDASWFGFRGRELPTVPEPELPGSD